MFSISANLFFNDEYSVNNSDNVGLSVDFSTTELSELSVFFFSLKEYC